MRENIPFNLHGDGCVMVPSQTQKTPAFKMIRTRPQYYIYDSPPPRIPQAHIPLVTPLPITPDQSQQNTPMMSSAQPTSSPLPHPAIEDLEHLPGIYEYLAVRHSSPRGISLCDEVSGEYLLKVALKDLFRIYTEGGPEGEGLEIVASFLITLMEHVIDLGFETSSDGEKEFLMILRAIRQDIEDESGMEEESD